MAAPRRWSRIKRIMLQLAAKAGEPEFADALLRMWGLSRMPHLSTPDSADEK